MPSVKQYVFPLPWPVGSMRRARRDAWHKLLQVAPTLRVPAGAALEVEFVFIPPNRRKPSGDWLEAWREATRLGFLDFLRCGGELIVESHRLATVPTPGGEVLVKLRVVPLE